MRVVPVEALTGDAEVGQKGARSACVFCKDAIAIYDEVRARGIDAKRPFVGNGLWTVGVVDPDGYNLFFESPADAPEESELPESNPGPDA